MIKKTIQYKKLVMLEVSDDGRIFQNGKELKKYLLTAERNREYVQAYSDN